MTTPRRLALASALVLALAGGSAAAVRSALPPGRVLPGVRVDGHPLPDDVAKGDDAAVRAWIAKRVERALGGDVELVVGQEKRKVPVASLVGPADLDRLVATLRWLGHERTLAARLDTAWRAKHGQIDVPIDVAVDTAAVEKLLAGVKGLVDDTPRDARLDLAAHTIVADHPGASLELDGAVVEASAALSAHLRNALRTDGPPPAAPTVVLHPASISAKVTREALAKLDIGTVVGTFETHFGRGGDQAPRAQNIENAAKKLDGLVINPGQIVSFNAIVGERSEANGFKVAWEIFKGEMRPGVGGGTCQVASTFHAASFFGGLEVLERLPHSRPSAYIPMGLDSTVVWPVVDLKVKNPHSFPVVVHTKVDGNTLHVELLGKKKPVSVVFGRDVVDTYPYTRKIEEDPSVKVGKAIKKQGGIRGYRVRRVRTLKYEDGTHKTETSYDFYPPTVEIYRVAPGTDPADLPALPDDVAEALAKKTGTPPPSGANVDAVACAGDCEGQPKQPLEVLNGAGVHDAVGDQANPMKSVSIKH